MRKIRTLLALCLIFLGVTTAMADGTFKDFTIDLTKKPIGDLPAGVEQISYPQNGATYNGPDHGWCWFAAKFAVEGPVKITLGGCEYASAGSAYVLDEAGNKLTEIDTKGAGCYHNGGEVSWIYKGAAQNLSVYCGKYCPLLKVEKVELEGFKDFEVNLQAESFTLPEGVTQVSYSDKAARFNDAQHGWQWFGAKFDVDGPVKISLGTCQYINAGNEGYVTDASGNKIGDIKNRTADEKICYHNNGSVASYEYTGGPATLIVYGGEYCPYVNVKKIQVLPENIKNKTIYKTNFQDWTAAKAEESHEVKVKTQDNQEITFTLSGTQVDPTGTDTKLTSECITPGFLKAEKAEKQNGISATITTTAFASVTSVKFSHGATGGSRGWGLKVKGDGDNDWVIVSDKFANPSAGTEVTVDVDRKNVQLQFYNLSSNNYAFMTNLEINGLVEVEPRTFKDFKVDFRTNPYTVVTPKDALPSGVTVDAGKYKDTQHGAQYAKITVPVDGPVKFTIGGCQYTNKQATVSINGGDPITIDNKTPGCDNGIKANEPNQYDKFATYIYNEEKAATLTFDLGEYCPYFMAEACDFIPNVIVSYFNTDGKLIGEETIPGNSELKYKYSASDVTVNEGTAFRGWFNSKAATAKKVKEGTTITEDIKLYAKTTPIEVAKLGAIFDYPLNSTSFYPEDHELLEVNGKFNDTQHGYSFGKDQSISVKTAGNALLVLGTCKYPENATATITITDAEGNVVGETLTVPSSTTDGVAVSIPYNGPATTLTATFSAQAYIHYVKVYNIESIPTKNAHGYYEVAAGDAAGLILAINSLSNGDKIFLPNGTYDLGETVLTTISVDNVSIIGESMEKTIIRNAPDKSIEGIGTTATLLNTSKNLYLQDLTLKNDLDYYSTGSAGRAVCLQDKGQNTICKNVKMLSYQDTYYSNSASKFYWEDSEIHGTVDYLCGDGDIIYNRCKFVNESRAKNSNSGSDVLCAPYTTESLKWGYVFLDCTVKSNCESFTFARAWGGAPKAQFIRTQLLDGTLANTRFTPAGMNVLADKFAEYGTINVDGNPCAPKSNKVTFTLGSDSKELETILTDEEAAAYTVENIFGTWAPDKIAAQYSNPDEGEIFLVDGKITTERPTDGKYRIANERGGFGPVIDLKALRQIDGKDVTAQYIKNADFSQEFEGWTVENFVKDDKTGNYSFAKQNLSGNAAEAYSGWKELTTNEYSLTQKIKLPAGKFKLVCSAFYRQKAAYNSNATKCLATLKAGDKNVSVKTLGSETLASYANDLKQAAGVFTSGMYTNEVEFETTGNGSTEIGIEGTFDEIQSWLAVGGFKLYDMNQKADIIDMTNRIVNNTFENDFTGWTMAGDWSNKTAEDKESETILVGTRYAEKWQNNTPIAAGKLSQTITGLENGKYIVKASAIANGEGTQLFANDKVVEAPSEATILSIEVEVTDGTITLGYERTAQNKASWVAVDNFQLFYVQNQPTAIITVIAPTSNVAPKKFMKNGKIYIIKNGRTYNVAGVETK